MLLGNQNSVSSTILIFDLELGGHHTDYIQYLLDYWSQNELQRKLYIVVQPEFLSTFPDVIKLASQCQSGIIKFVPITPEEQATIVSKLFTVQKIFARWQILCKYVHQLQADQCVLMHYDLYQLPLALQLKMPCMISGIYFRPTLHYHTFSNYESSLSSTLRAWRHWLFLKMILRRSKLNMLFSLDPYAVPYIKQNFQSDKITVLPDPVKCHPEAKVQAIKLRKKLNIQGDRTLFLLFGALAQRKGVYELLEALFLLPVSTIQKMALVIVGQIRDLDQIFINTQIENIQRSSSIQIVRHHQFIPEKDIQPYFQAADVILALYQRHTGMSGILNRAAVARKPVLTSNYGLTGELVHQYRLGMSIDTTLPAEIAKALQIFVEQPVDQLFDYDKLHEFAQTHSPEKFARTIFNAMM